jgi:diguanylate cyclase (GGDEF)-like protein
MPLFINELSKLMERSSGKTRFAVAYLDIDNFRYINQALGQKVGNELLQYVAHNLEPGKGDSYMAARLGGDKFAMLFTDIQSTTLLFSQLSAVKDKICPIWSACKHNFYVSYTMGISIYPDHGKDIAALLNNAEIAMSMAKKQGKDMLFYKEELQQEYIWKVQIANELQAGMEENEFTIFYQPIFNLSTGKITGVESLVRWLHPKRGMISPDLFIPVAEESKQIYLLEKWIISKALQQKKEWEEEGFYDIELSINVSSKTLENDLYYKEIEKIFLSYNIDYSKVIVEVTETSFLFNIDFAAEHLYRLKKLGIKIALDDFGTGYSSLTHLKELPVDILKIDRSFVNTIPKCEKDILIVKHLLSIAHDLKYQVIAEGIETKKQLEVLKQYSCELGQGFLFYKPMPEEKVRKLFTNS